MTRSCVQDPRETMGIKPHRALSWRREQPCSGQGQPEIDVKRMVSHAQRTLVPSVHVRRPTSRRG